MVVVGVSACWFFAVFVTVPRAPDVYALRGWPLWVFCGGTLTIAAAGIIADNRRLARCRGSKSQPIHPTGEAASVASEASEPPERTQQPGTSLASEAPAAPEVPVSCDDPA